MRLPQIRTETTQAKIAIETRHAQQSIQQPGAELDLQQPQAELFIERIPSKLTIDQTAAWESMDLKTVRKRIEEAAANGQSAVLEGIARRAQEGNELMKIENKGNPIAAHAKKNSERPENNFNIGFIHPHLSVKVDYEPGKVNIDWKVNKVINETTTNAPIIGYEAGKVDTSLQQRNALDIDFINVNFNE